VLGPPVHEQERIPIRRPRLPDMQTQPTNVNQ
jgi:hypothetical protein